MSTRTPGKCRSGLHEKLSGSGQPLETSIREGRSVSKLCSRPTCIPDH